MAMDRPEISLFSSDYARRRYQVYAALRDRYPAFYTREGGGFWMLSRYADVRKATMDWQTFTSSLPGTIVIPHTSPPAGLSGIPIEVDPPRHTLYRAAIADYFSRPVVERQEAAMQAIADDIIDGLQGQPACDLVHDYARPVVLRCLALFFGLPVEHIVQWDQWTQAIFSARTTNLEQQTRAFEAMLAYFAREFAERRRQPGSDYFSLVSGLTLNGRRLSPAELNGYGRMMVIAGRGATVDGLGNSLWYLARQPPVRRQLLADPELLRSAVEEFLRLMTPVEWLGRVATTDVVIHGAQIHRGDSVALNFACANHDERVFEVAEACVLGRRPNPHMAFGAGPHSCLGAHVARLILRVGIQAFLRRLPRFQLDEDRPPQSAGFGGVFSFQSLPVRLGSEGGHDD
jgi:cytochrome P450